MGSLALRSSRLLLRPPLPEDDEHVAKIRSDPLARTYLESFSSVCSIEDARIRRESRAGDERICDLHIHLIDPSSNSSFVGQAGLFDINLVNCSAEAGILVDPTLHGKGIATEAIYLLLNHAFDTLRLHRIVFETAHNNAPLRGLFKKVFGIEPEFQLKEAWKGKSGWVDAVGYRLLDYEWREGVKERVEMKILQSKPQI